MADLFSYIEHVYALPARISTIDVENQSEFQNALSVAAQGENAYAAVRQCAGEFLAARFPTPVADPVESGGQLRDFRTAVESWRRSETSMALRQLAESIFESEPAEFVRSQRYRADKEMLENAVVALKITTGFTNVDAGALVRAVQTVALIDHIAGAGPAVFTKELVERLLARPVRIPAAFLIPPTTARTGPAPQSDDGPAAPGDPLEALRARRDRLQATYESLMSLQPHQLEIAPEPEPEPDTDQTEQPHLRSLLLDTADSGPAAGGARPAVARLRIAAPARQGLAEEQRSILDDLPVDAATAPFEQVVNAVKQQWIQADREFLPAAMPKPARVYRMGAHLFAVGETTGSGGQDAPPAMPDFSHAVARPAGVGNLQVVRQELIGYQAGDISHIENVLEGEVFRRSTHREEMTEITSTEETQSAQSQERDNQSTSRNELAVETQREAGQQTSASSELSSSTGYGKLVENSRSNYAQSVTARAVDSVTSMVRKQRVQRERRTFVENAVHELDNAKGTKKIRGIYQWVDKKYSVRVLNYGKRLLYDVVVPEPAAFLIQALRDGAQSETFQLVKPADPGLAPKQLNASNYSYYAATYGVTGSVSPPPAEFTRTVAHVDKQKVEVELNAFGGKFHGQHFDAFVIDVPENYKAISGYIQQVNQSAAAPVGRYMEFYIGQSVYRRFGPNDIVFLNDSFTMAGETGQIPVTVKSVDSTMQFAYAIGINCQRTDQAYEQWQLKTHAAIMAGYQRQLADYQDKLARYTTAMRNQMAMAGNYAHDPTIEREELKKAFIYLLLGEHFGSYLPTPAPAPMPPLGGPPDPVAVKRWGAMVAFFERAFEWENLMHHYYPYFWGRVNRWQEMLLTQDADPRFEAFLKAGAARVVVPVRPGFEAALAHYHETGDVWLGEEIPDMFSDYYVSIIQEIKAANRAPGDEVCVTQWEVTLPTTLVMLKEDEQLPSWKPTACEPQPET